MYVPCVAYVTHIVVTKDDSNLEGFEGIEGGDGGNQLYVFEIMHPMCDDMIGLINKLKVLPDTAAMNKVLDNLSILKVVVNRDTKKILLYPL